jgi:hypothetical protein
MATTIKLKSSSVSGQAPTTSNLDLRELAINTADGKLYVRQGTGVVGDTIVDLRQRSIDDALVLAIALG